MRLAAVDIGTNSVRLLVVDHDRSDLVRRTVITGLGRGMQHTGRLNPDGRVETLAVLGEYRREMEGLGAGAVRAVMTAVGRSASDVEPFLEEAKGALGIRPQVISGHEEARLSYRGAVAGLEGGDWTVVDIGGGSTEIVSAAAARSADIGSVRLTDLFLGARPAPAEAVETAREHARRILAGEKAPDGVVGVAGTWTTLAALTLEEYDPERVHHFTLGRSQVTGWVERLAMLSVEETAALPGIEPRRAPVILGGAIVAEQVMEVLGVDHCLVSERDLLDGIVAGLRDAG